MKLTFYEFDEQGRRVGGKKHTLGDGRITMVHDLCVTDNYYVLVLGSIKMDMSRLPSYMLGWTSIAECFAFDASLPVRVVLVPRNGGDDVPAIVADGDAAFFTFHHVNAHEEPDGRVVVQTAGWRSSDFSASVDSLSLDYWAGGQRSELYELTVDPRRHNGDGRAVARVERLLDDQTLEFPVVAPSAVSRRHTHVYAVGDRVHDVHLWGPPQALLKISLGAAEGGAPSVSRWVPPHERRVFLNEPLFVPRPGGCAEDDGWVLVTGVEAAAGGHGRLYILDARDLGAGPVATLRLPHALPLGLHGAFTSEYLGPDPRDAAVPRWREVATYRQISG
mmetsp:Transcript_29065/g.86040  ORF Transcript_29065/g.86040 Transcript_29065/m.86040 type:complete len:334 (-) Transcript_29065:1069-2070(-)